MRLALVGTFYRRHENTLPLVRRVMLESTRQPDEFWLMVEDRDDRRAAERAMASLFPGGYDERIYLIERPTPRTPEGRYAVIPYSNKINFALDHTDAEVIAYLDNGSMPDPRKYDVAMRGLAEHPEWGAVYVGQHRTGMADHVAAADQVVPDAFCRLNYTQVIHRATADRWTLDMAHADPDLADALFWRSLHASLGPFYPVAPGEVLDEHHIPDSKAVGL